VYAKGVATRDISSHLRDVYGVDTFAEMISHMTDRILPIAKEWQNRPLKRKYAIVFMHAVGFMLRISQGLNSRMCRLAPSILNSYLLNLRFFHQSKRFTQNVLHYLSMFFLNKFLSVISCHFPLLDKNKGYFI